MVQCLNFANCYIVVLRLTRKEGIYEILQSDALNGILTAHTAFRQLPPWDTCLHVLPEDARNRREPASSCFFHFGSCRSRAGAWAPAISLEDCPGWKRLRVRVRWLCSSLSTSCWPQNFQKMLRLARQLLQDRVVWKCRLLKGRSGPAFVCYLRLRCDSPGTSPVPSLGRLPVLVLPP